ncbi:hypothetical protein QFC20_001506 [Naganishia adeliensis]|uniref:Uncharacterized protein n=1 Tax=Naganishia adeliensis TaxID=92952 RepID=A0ACC2WSD3_9TREE|nr:hypothetical protein QFC20_001506 [Naganishia adeliensis]
MPDPKLLAFSILLGSVSLYLLFKSKRSQPSKKSPQKAEESSHKSQERRAHLMEKAARVEKACKKLDARFLQEVAEMKTLAKQYKEQMQEGEKEGWKVEVKTGSDLASVDSASTSGEDDRPKRKKDSTSIYPGLRYKVVGTKGSGSKQQLEFTFSGVPAPDVDEDDKKSTSNEGSLRVSDLVKDAQYATSVYRQLMPKKLPASTAALLGHGFATANEERDYAFFLNQLLGTLGPRSIEISFLPSDESGKSAEIDIERCLLPAKQMPLALIGNKLFRNKQNALDTLEIGPFIPVLQGSSGEPSKTSAHKILPNILFDLTYGFVRMMSGAQGNEKAEREPGTKIVLVVPDEAQVKRFRKTVEGLAKVRNQEEEEDDEFADPASRLELFQRKLYYTVDGHAKDRPRTVWQV